MRESLRDRRLRSVAARVGQDSGRSAPCVQPNTPGGHQRENVRSARQLSPRRVQFSVAKSVQFSVAIDNRPIRVHPRACGGNPQQDRLVLSIRGPSPRVRGKPASVSSNTTSGRSIPARAGETPSRTDPRACGGNRLASRPTPRLGGPSPRVRGKRSASPFCGSGQGSIPARAGETSLLPASASRMRVHPRACGGNQLSKDTRGAVQGPSPRVRGKPDWIRLFEVLKHTGPSPRVRGKPALQGHTWCCSGSIPARAGETG